MHEPDPSTSVGFLGDLDSEKARLRHKELKPVFGNPGARRTDWVDWPLFASEQVSGAPAAPDKTCGM